MRGVYHRRHQIAVGLDDIGLAAQLDMDAGCFARGDMLDIINRMTGIAPKLDKGCPTPVGIRPGCGAIMAMLEKATGKKAFSVGKPSPVMMRAARKEISLDASHNIMVGDTMETDILGGLQMGYTTVLVLSGSTERMHLPDYAYQPDIVVESVAELLDSKLLHIPQVIAN